jgi:hypothetical protein
MLVALGWIHSLLITVLARSYGMLG